MRVSDGGAVDGKGRSVCVWPLAGCFDVVMVAQEHFLLEVLDALNPFCHVKLLRNEARSTKHRWIAYMRLLSFSFYLYREEHFLLEMHGVRAELFLHKTPPSAPLQHCESNPYILYIHKCSLTNVYRQTKTSLLRRQMQFSSSCRLLVVFFSSHRSPQSNCLPHSIYHHLRPP